MNITKHENSELSVKPFDNQHKRSSSLHPDLLHPPFSLLLVGPKGSGKGNCTLTLIFGNQKKKGTHSDHHKFYRHHFDKIYVFSPTWTLDPQMRRCQFSFLYDLATNHCFIQLKRFLVAFQVPMREII